MLLMSVWRIQKVEDDFFSLLNMITRTHSASDVKLLKPGSADIKLFSLQPAPPFIKKSNSI